MDANDSKLENYIKTVSELPEWHRNKIYRLSLRLLNNDAKVYRLISLKDSGQISFTQFLNML